MSDEKQRETALLLTPEVARDFERLLVEYAEANDQTPDEARRHVERRVAELGLAAVEEAIRCHREFNRKMGWT